MRAPGETDERGRPLAVLTRWWRNWKSRDAALRELAGCGERETAHLASDLGVGVAELKTLAGRWPDSSNLLEWRMVALGLNADRIGRDQPALMRDLQRACGQCAQESRCEQDLRRNETRGLWRDYCANVATLDELQAADHGRRP